MSGTKTTKNRQVQWLGYGACALAGCIWGTGFYFGRRALNEMSVEYMVLYRFLFALLGMLPVLLRNRVRFSGEEMRMLFVSAALGIPVQFLLQFHGLARTTVSHAALMVGSMPVLLAVGASIFAGERLDWTGWLALAGSTVGAGLVVLGGTQAGNGAGHETPTLTGDLLVVASLVTALGWILLSKKLMFRHSPPIVTAYTILVGTVMLAALIFIPLLFKPWIPNHSADMPFARLSATAWIALSVSGVAGTALTTLLWNWGIHHVPTSRAGVFLNVEPVLGSILGVELLGEHLGPYAWLGGGLILGAAVTMTVRGHDPEVVLE